jgi:hypothetical protein
MRFQRRLRGLTPRRPALRRRVGAEAASVSRAGSQRSAGRARRLRAARAVFGRACLGLDLERLCAEGLLAMTDLRVQQPPHGVPAASKCTLRLNPACRWHSVGDTGARHLRALGATRSGYGEARCRDRRRRREPAQWPRFSGSRMAGGASAQRSTGLAGELQPSPGVVFRR